MKKLSAGEELLAQHLTLNGIEYVREHAFIPGRRFRADFLIQGTRLLIEVEGGLWINGRHNRASSAEADYRKYNLAAIHGWTVLRFSTAMVKSGEAIEMICQVVRGAER